MANGNVYQIRANSSSNILQLIWKGSAGSADTQSIGVTAAGDFTNSRGDISAVGHIYSMSSVFCSRPYTDSAFAGLAMGSEGGYLQLRSADGVQVGQIDVINENTRIVLHKDNSLQSVFLFDNNGSLTCKNLSVEDTAQTNENLRSWSLGVGRVIPASTDLNNVYDVGNYACDDYQTAQSYGNTPTNNVFVMKVYSVTGKNALGAPAAGTWKYGVQEMHTQDNKHWQRCFGNHNTATYSFGDWRQNVTADLYNNIQGYNVFGAVYN